MIRPRKGTFGPTESHTKDLPSHGQVFGMSRIHERLGKGYPLWYKKACLEIALYLKEPRD